MVKTITNVSLMALALVTAFAMSTAALAASIISESEALDIAEDFHGSSIEVEEIELEYEDGSDVPVYEVEFTDENGDEREILIDAETGDVFGYEEEDEEDDDYEDDEDEDEDDDDDEDEDEDEDEDDEDDDENESENDDANVATAATNDIESLQKRMIELLTQLLSLLRAGA